MAYDSKLFHQFMQWREQQAVDQHQELDSSNSSPGRGTSTVHEVPSDSPNEVSAAGGSIATSDFLATRSRGGKSTWAFRY